MKLNWSKLRESCVIYYDNNIWNFYSFSVKTSRILIRNITRYLENFSKKFRTFWGEIFRKICRQFYEIIVGDPMRYTCYLLCYIVTLLHYVQRCIFSLALFGVTQRLFWSHRYTLFHRIGDILCSFPFEKSTLKKKATINHKQGWV